MENLHELPIFTWEMPDHTKAEINDAMASAPEETKGRISKLEADIQSTMEEIQSVPKDEWTKDALFPSIKTHGDLIQELEEILEEQRAKKVILKHTGQKHL